MSRVSKSITYVLSSSTNEDGHLGGVNALKYNNMSRTLFSAGRDGTVKVWQNDETVLFNRQGVDFHESIGDTNNIDINNQYIANETASINKNGVGFLPPLVYKGSYNMVQSQQLHTDWVNDLELVDNQSLVTCSSDLLIKHWNYRSNTENVIGYHTDYVQCLAVPNSSFRDSDSLLVPLSPWIASGGLDKQVHTWDLQKGCRIATYTTMPSKSSGTSNLNFYNIEDKGSIYALSATDNLIAVGGTENSVGLIDTRANSHMFKLVGHSDTVRSVVLSDEWLLSGSADSTVKLWSLKNNRVFRTFDMHNSSVWSLYSSFEDFRIFFSGDKNGCVYKSDLRGCHLSDFNQPDGKIDGKIDDTDNEIMSSKLNENLGIFALVAKQPHGINSLVVENIHFNTPTNKQFDDNGGCVWCATNDNTVESFLNPNLKDLALHQYLTVKTNFLSVLQNGFETPPEESETNSISGKLPGTHYNDDLYELVSQLSLENPGSKPEKRPLSFIDTLDTLDNMSFASVPDDVAPSCSLETSFVNLNGSPSSHYFNSADQVITEDPVATGNITVVPMNGASCCSLEGYAAVIKAQILNDRKSLVTLDDFGLVRLWNIVTGDLINSFSSDCSDLEDDMDEDEYEKQFNERSEHLFQSIVSEYTTKETLPNWCQVSVRIGKVFITMTESLFTNCEVYVDELEGILDPSLAHSIKHDNPNPMDEIRVNLGKMILKSLLFNFVQKAIHKDQIFRQQIIDGALDTKQLLKDPTYSQFEDHFDSAPPEKSRESPPAGRKSFSNNDSSNDNAFKKFARFGRKSKKEEKPPKPLSKPPEQPPIPQPKPTTADSSSTLSKTSNKLSFSSYLDSVQALLDRIEYDYLKSADVHSLKESVFKLSSNKEVPVVTQLVSKPVLILINENLSTLKGNALNLYQFYSNDTLTTENYHHLKEFLPFWIGKALFKNEYLDKPVTKINFIIEEWKPPLENGDDSNSDGKKSSEEISHRKKILSLISSSNTSDESDDTLPPLQGSNYRLSAYQMIRIKKVMFYILEKFQHRTPEMKLMYPYANIKYEDSIKVEDWLEILCNDEVLPLDMTLITVKTKIWRSSGDIVLKYRRKKSSAETSK